MAPEPIVCIGDRASNAVVDLAATGITTSLGVQAPLA